MSFNYTSQQLSRALGEAGEALDHASVELEDVAAAAVKAAREERPFVDVWEADR